MYWDTFQKEGGFDFSTYQRNKALNTNLKHTYTKTGTTIVGITFKDGIILGSDTRATNGDIVANLDCQKLHYLAPNIYCAGAGTAADLEKVSEMMASELELHRLNTNRESRVSHVEARMCNHLFRYMGYIGCALIVGGIDCKGPHLVNITPYGNSTHLPFTTMGSGSLAAMSILETNYKDNMTEEEGISLVTKAIEAGIFNDEGSGSNVDLFIITKKGLKKLESYRSYNFKTYNTTKNYVFEKGLTPIIEEVKKNWNNVEVKNEKMEIEEL